MKFPHHFAFRSSFALVAAALALSACNDKKTPTGVAPSSSSLSAAKGSEKAQSLEIEAAGSKVTFVMNAPIEKIHGEAPDSAKGELFVDPNDLTKTTGLVQVDLDKLSLFQQKRDDEKSEYGEKKKVDKQNEHMRNWLEIDAKAPADQREKNRWVQYKIDKVLEVSEKDLTKMTGAERKVTATVEGEFRLHQKAARKQAKLEATFKVDGDKIQSVSFKTVSPVAIGLPEYDVRPRDFFGKLADKTLDDLGQKVAKEAPIELEMTAKAK